MRTRRAMAAAGRGGGTRWVVAAALGLATACRPPSSTRAPAESTPVVPSSRVDSTPPPADAVRGSVDARLAARGVAATITPRLHPEPRVRIELTLGAPAEALAVLRVPGPVSGLPAELAAHDAEGPVDYAATLDDDGALTLRTGAAIAPPLSLRYELRPAPARAGATSRLAFDAAAMFATGDALLALPEDALFQRQPLHVRIETGGLGSPAGDDAPTSPWAVSTFGDGAEFRGEGLPYELLRAGYAAGRLEHASFEARGGSDRFAAFGGPRYDTRWIAAEVAGLRTEIDIYFGQRSAGTYMTLLAAGPKVPGVPAHVAELRGRGLVITAGAAATWDAPARLDVATSLVQRWLGGRVRMVEREGEAPSFARSLWFHGGVSRFVARELLLELGLLSPAEYRAELDAIELELAASPVRGWSRAELVAALDHANPRVVADARAQMVARGAMYATWADASLRDGPSRQDLREVLSTVVAVAVVEDRPTVARGDWLGYIRGWSQRDADAEFESVVGKGRRPRLRKGALGPCFVARPATRRRFTLGMVDVSTPGSPGAVMIDPEGPAARAGLRADDEIVGLSYVDGDPRTKAEVIVSRGGQTVRIRYLPSGRPAKGIRWQRVAGVSDEHCVR